MRAKDFIPEEKTKDVHPEQKAVMNPSLVLTDMDPGYDYYRFLMHAAASPTDVPVDTVFKASPFAMPYTPQEEEMLHHGLGKMGKKHKHISPDDSREPDGTNAVSPVPQNSGRARKKR